jgi:imidazolonepropionase-like amidohydrolase
MEILIEDAAIADVPNSVGRPRDAKVLDLSERTVCLGFMDTHVHLCVDGLNLARQTLQCAPAAALGNEPCHVPTLATLKGFPTTPGGIE